MSIRNIEEKEYYITAGGTRSRTGFSRVIKSLNSVIPSSWIDRIHWEAAMCKLEILTRDGDVMVYDDVSEEDAYEIVTGQAMCKTDDPTGKMRWYPGKTPSLGAAFNYILPNAKNNPAAAPELTEAEAYIAFVKDPFIALRKNLEQKVEDKKVKIRKIH